MEIEQGEIGIEKGRKRMTSGENPGGEGDGLLGASRGSWAGLGRGTVVGPSGVGPDWADSMPGRRVVGAGIGAERPPASPPQTPLDQRG